MLEQINEKKSSRVRVDEAGETTNKNAQKKSDFFQLLSILLVHSFSRLFIISRFFFSVQIQKRQMFDNNRMRMVRTRDEK